MGQAQSGNTVGGADGPSRHVKVPADLLIPTNIVIDDNELLQAVQRRIGRGALAPFFPPTENETDEECPICCDHFRDFNWFTCCNHPICSECFVRLWQERLEALDTAIACPFCKQPEGDAHLRFIRLSEKVKKARRKAEEESVHAQRRAQLKEREDNPLSALNATAREQMMWAPAAANAYLSAPSSQDTRRGAAVPHASTPTSPSAALPASSPRANAAPRHSRTPSAAVTELALEVASAVQERSHHSERSYHGGSRHGSREPSNHGGAGRSRHGGTRQHSREPSAHGGAGSSNRGGSVHGSREPSGHGSTYWSRHGDSRLAGVSRQRNQDAFSKLNATAQEHSAWAPTAASGTLSGALSSPDARTTPAAASPPVSPNAALVLPVGHKSASGDVAESPPAVPGASQHQHASERSRHGVADRLPSREPSAHGCTDHSRNSRNVGSMHVSREPSRNGGADRSQRSQREGFQHTSRETSTRAGAAPFIHVLASPTSRESSMHGRSRAPSDTAHALPERSRTSIPPTASLDAQPLPHLEKRPDMHASNASQKGSATAKAGTIPPARTDAVLAARAAQARLNKGAAPAGAVRPGHQATSQDHVRSHARATHLSQSRQSQASVDSSGAEASTNPSIASSRRRVDVVKVHDPTHAQHAALRQESRRPSDVPLHTPPSYHNDPAAPEESHSGMYDDLSITSTRSSDSRRVKRSVNKSARRLWNLLPKVFSSKDKSAPSPTPPPQHAQHASTSRLNRKVLEGSSDEVIPVFKEQSVHGANRNDRSSAGEGSLVSTRSQPHPVHPVGGLSGQFDRQAAPAAPAATSARATTSLPQHNPPAEPLLPVIPQAPFIQEASDLQNLPSVAHHGVFNKRDAVHNPSASSRSRKTDAETAAAPAALGAAYSLQPPATCSAAPMHELTDEERQAVPTAHPLSHSTGLSHELWQGQSIQPQNPEKLSSVQAESTTPGVCHEALAARLQHLTATTSSQLEAARKPEQLPPASGYSVSSSVVLLPEASHRDGFQTHPAQSQAASHLSHTTKQLKVPFDAAAVRLDGPVHASHVSTVADSQQSTYTVADTVSTVVSQVPRVRHIFAGHQPAQQYADPLPLESRQLVRTSPFEEPVPECDANGNSDDEERVQQGMRRRMCGISISPRANHRRTGSQTFAASARTSAPPPKARRARPAHGNDEDDASSNSSRNTQRRCGPFCAFPTPSFSREWHSDHLPTSSGRLSASGQEVATSGVSAEHATGAETDTESTAESEGLQHRKLSASCYAIDVATGVMADLDLEESTPAGAPAAISEPAPKSRTPVSREGSRNPRATSQPSPSQPDHGSSDIITPASRTGATATAPTAPRTGHNQRARGAPSMASASNFPAGNSSHSAMESSGSLYSHQSDPDTSQATIPPKASAESRRGPHLHAPKPPTHSSFYTPEQQPEHELGTVRSTSHVDEEDNSVASSIRRELGRRPENHRTDSAKPTATFKPPYSQRVHAVSDQDNTPPQPPAPRMRQQPHLHVRPQARIQNLPEPSEMSPATDQISRASSGSVSEDDVGHLYTRAANVATGVAAAAVANASVVIADASSFSFHDNDFHRRTPSGTNLYGRITKAATGVEEEMATGVSAVPGSLTLHDVASDPDLHSMAERNELLQYLRRERSTPVPGSLSLSPDMFENSMHGSSVSGGEVLHASRFAEATLVATRVAVAAGGVSPDVSVHGPSMHGSIASAADEDSSWRNVRAARVATGAARRDIGDGSSAGASSISFGDDGSMHRHITSVARSPACVASGGMVASPSDGSHRSSLSFGASSHHGRYSHAARVASGLSAAAAAAGDVSSAGASFISFGDDISMHHQSPRAGSKARTARDVDAEQLLRHQGAAAAPSVRSRSVHAGSGPSGLLRSRGRRNGSMHATSVHAGSVHSGSLNDRSKRHKSSVNSADASSYARSVAAGVIASVSGSGSVHGHVEYHPRSSGGSSSQVPASVQQQRAQLRASHRMITHHESAPNVHQDDDSLRSRLNHLVLATTSPSDAPYDTPVDDNEHTCMDDSEELRVHGNAQMARRVDKTVDFEDDTEEMSSDLVFAPEPHPRDTISEEEHPKMYYPPSQSSNHPSSTYQSADDASHSTHQDANSRYHNSEMNHSASPPSTEAQLSKDSTFVEAPDEMHAGAAVSTSTASVALAIQKRVRRVVSGHVSNGAGTSGSANTDEVFESLSPGIPREEKRMLETALELSRVEGSLPDPSVQERVYSSDRDARVESESASPVVHRSAKEAFSGRVAARVAEIDHRRRVDNHRELQGNEAEHRSGAVGVRASDGPVYSSGETRLMAARRRKRQQKESAAQQQQNAEEFIPEPTDAALAVVAASGGGSRSSRLRRPVGAARSSVCRQELRQFSSSPPAASQRGLKITHEQQRKALEATMPPGVLNNILEQVEEMDEEELADFLHAIELSCKEPSMGHSGSPFDVSDTAPYAESPHAVCEQIEEGTIDVVGYGSWEPSNSAAVGLKSPFRAAGTRAGNAPHCDVVSSAPTDSGTFCGNVLEASDSASSGDKRRQNDSSIRLQEESRSMSKSDMGDTPQTITPRSHDQEPRSPTSKLVHECAQALDELILGGDAISNEDCIDSLMGPTAKRSVSTRYEPINQGDKMHARHSSSKQKSADSSGGRWWPDVSTRMRRKHTPRRSGAVAEGVLGMHEGEALCSSSLLQSAAGTMWPQGNSEQVARMHARFSWGRRREPGAVGESSMPQSCANTHMRSPSFDFCMDLCDDDTPANACPPCTPIVELEDGQVHAEAGSDSDMDELDYAQYTGTSFSTRAAVIDRVELECSNCVQMDYAWRQCIRAAGHAVCEAYSDEEEMDGAEIFRDEGEDGLQGPGVPEGAVAGVIVIQPDGSPCIGWLVAHPTIAHLSDTMRRGLVTLNVLHARDLELQTRIACDDDRIRSAIARYNRADPENPQEDALSAGGTAIAVEYLRTTALDGRTAALGGPTTALDGRTTTELESNIMAGHASTSEVPMPALSSSPPVPTSASRIVDDSRIVSAIVMGDRSGKPNTRMSQRDDNAALESVQDVAALPDEQGLVKEEEIAEASGSIQKDEDSAASQPSMEVEKEDWLERMRRRDAELQARIAKHDATMYGRTD